MGPRSGIRGAGSHDLNSLKWLNKIKVLGTTALQITEAEAEKSSELMQECFKHAVNRQIFGDQLKKDITRAVEPDFKKSDAQGAFRRLYPTFV